MSSQRYISDELTHFVGRELQTDDERYDLLVKILTDGWLIAPGTLDDKGKPRENRWNRKYHWGRKLSEPEGLFCPSAVCFCDIPVADLGLHVRKYSKFGLAFTKAFLIDKGAAPVFYLPKGGRLFNLPGQTRGDILDEMEAELHRMSGLVPDGSPSGFHQPKLSKVEKFLEDIVLSYMKPFDETITEDDPNNYYMEREWRTLISVRFNLQDVRRIVIPEAYGTKLRQNVPMYAAQVTFVT
jgi:hypothetical protein